MTRANAIAAPRRKCTRSTRSPSGECRGERTVNAPRSYASPPPPPLRFTRPPLPLLLTQVEGKVHRRLLPRPLRPILGRDGDRLHHWLLPWQHLAVRSYICIASASSFTTTIVQRAGDRPHLETHAMLPRSLSLPSSIPPSLHAGSCTPTTSTARTATPAVQDLENAHDPDARARTISTARR